MRATALLVGDLLPLAPACGSRGRAGDAPLVASWKWDSVETWRASHVADGELVHGYPSEGWMECTFRSDGTARLTGRVPPMAVDAASKDLEFTWRREGETIRLRPPIGSVRLAGRDRLIYTW